MYKIQDKDTHEIFMLKVISFEESIDSESRVEELWRQLRVLKELNHRNI